MAQTFPVVGITGARQVGKTTLALQIGNTTPDQVRRFDLEDPRHLAALQEPMLTLEPLQGLVILDEIQRRPDLFPVLRVLADRPANPCRWLVLGSASPALLRQSSESLAGRIGYHELPGLSIAEVGTAAAQNLWVRGGFPRSFLAPGDAASLLWREQFLRTFVEQDLPAMRPRVDPRLVGRLWRMLAHYHGQVLNSSELGRSLGVAHTTVRSWIDLLAGALMIRVLPPWHENLKKRQVKAPKIYIRDSGLLHALLDVRDDEGLEHHPKLGASWEGFALEQTLQHLGIGEDRAWFWRSHAGEEVDLLVTDGSVKTGYEFKRTASPYLTASMRTAIDVLRLERLDVVIPGDLVFPLAPRVRAIGLQALVGG